MQSPATGSMELESLLIYFGVLLVLIAGLLLISYLLGERHREAATDTPFECGVQAVGDTHIRLPIPYFLVAILFVIFDLEAVYLFAWAVSLQQSGWAGFIEVTLFIAILLLALYYLIKLNALDWGPRGHGPIRAAPRQGDSDIVAGLTPTIGWDQERGESYER